MAQANVYTSASAQAWYTDKAKITTGGNTVTYQVDVLYPSATGNLYSNPVQVSANSSEEIFVGVGNKLTIAGGNVTIQELGTTSSGSYAVRDTGGTLPY
jgi:hypothetical protein